MTSNWRTPQDFFKKWDRIFHFTLDVCANKHNAKCRKFFSKKQNALEQDWGKNVCWMNPPYRYRDFAKWMQKAYEASRRGATVVCLVPSSTDSIWFHEWAVKGIIVFIRGRLKFHGATGCGRAPFSNIVVVFPPYPEIPSWRVLKMNLLVLGEMTALQGGR